MFRGRVGEHSGEAPTKMRVLHRRAAELGDRRQQVDELDHRVATPPSRDARPGDHERIAGEARVEPRRPLLHQPEVAEVLAVVGEHDEHRVVELTGAFHRFDDTTELPVDPARHPVVRGNDLGEIFPREVVPAVSGAQRFHESRFSGRGPCRDRLRNECTIVEREPRLLDGERRVREHERDPHEPRLLRRSSFVEPLLGSADRRLVGVDHDLLAARTEIEPTGEAIGDRGAVPQRTGLRRDEVAAEIGACLGDARREDVAAMARDGDVVPRVAHDAEQVRLPRLQEVRQRPVAGHVRIPPGHHRHPARTAHGMLAERVRETNPALRECVDVGRLSHRVVEAPERIGAQLVGHEQHDVRAGGHRGTLRRRSCRGTRESREPRGTIAASTLGRTKGD